MPTLPTAAVSAASLVAGYAVASGTGVRALGGLVLAAGAAVCAREWLRRDGPAVTAALLGTYAGAFVLSHLLARSLGAWPAVLTVAAATAGVAYALSDRRRVPVSRP